jgi:PAS domain S-box-containing protein
MRTIVSLGGRGSLFRHLVTLSRLRRYAVAIGAAVAAIAVRLAFDSIWATKLPYITLFPAIMFSAWAGGLWPGVLTTAITAVATLYFWIEPVRSWAVNEPTELIGLATFVAVGVLISAMNEAWRRGTKAFVESEDRLNATLSQAGRMGTWEYALRTGDVKWSPGLEAIHGYAPGTFPGTFEAFSREIHRDDRDRVLKAIRQTVAERHDHHIEYRIVRGDGAVRWVEGRGQLFLDDAQQPERMVGVCSDITDRKGADERFRLAVEAAPAAMLMVDQRGTIVMANALTEQLLGYSREELLSLQVERLVPSSARAHHAAHRSAFQVESRSRPMGTGRDLFAVRKDGTELPVEVGLSPIETADGHFVLAAVTDISDRAGLLTREKAARSELERASRLKDDFLAVLSHELRTPLNAILGYATLLNLGALEADSEKHAVAAILRNAKAQARLIGDLLDLSRVMAGKLELDVDELELSRVVDTAVEVISPEANAKEIRLETDKSAAPIALRGDAVRLQQVFWHLLASAVKFTPRGGRIRVVIREQQGHAHVEVSDTGRGIRPEFLKHVFDRYGQEDRDQLGSMAGLGLGLALVRELVDAHQGRVVAHSAGEGLGSSFTVILPLSSAVESSDVKLPQRSLSTAESLSLDVLVVDDESDARDLMALTLVSRRSRVRAAASAQEALALIADRRPDVLLADLRMPNEDGYDLIRIVRAREREDGLRRLAAIAVTAYAASSDRDRAIAAGYDAHVPKPVDIDELMQAIARVAKLIPA